MRGTHVMKIHLLLSCVLAVNACKNDSTGPDPNNVPPVIAKISVERRMVAIGGSVSLSCTASDPNGNQLSYSWVPDAGSIIGTGATVSWQLPPAVGCYKVSVSVDDRNGGVALDSMYVRVAPQDTLVKVVIVRSDGNNYPTFWNSLNANWRSYGTTRLAVDYLSFDHQGITLAELLTSNADVVFVDDARNGLEGEILTPVEVDAVVQYVQKCHGLLITGGTFRPTEHAKFINLIGFSARVGGQVYFGESQADSIVITFAHPELFRNISTYRTASRNFYSGSDWNRDGTVGYPEDWKTELTSTKAQAVAFIWNVNHLTNHFECGTITYIEAPTYRGVFAGHRASGFSATRDDYQFYYNAIVFCAR